MRGGYRTCAIIEVTLRVQFTDLGAGNSSRLLRML